MYIQMLQKVSGKSWNSLPSPIEISERVDNVTCRCNVGVRLYIRYHRTQKASFGLSTEQKQWIFDGQKFSWRTKSKCLRLRCIFGRASLKVRTRLRSHFPKDKNVSQCESAKTDSTITDYPSPTKEKLLDSSRWANRRTQAAQPPKESGVWPPYPGPQKNR